MSVVKRRRMITLKKSDTDRRFVTRDYNFWNVPRVQLRIEMGTQINDKVYFQVKNQIEENVWTQVKNQVYDNFNQI
jgi:hypothetical protein